MDRRQRKTRQAIYAAFEELVEQEPYGSITVAQIIERADVGRSTFYAHFETKDELLQDMCTEMFDHIFEGVNAQCITHRHLKASDAKGRLAHLLYHLRDAYGSICGKLLKEGEPIFTKYFRDRLRGAFELDPPRIPAGMPFDLAVEMLVSAFCQTVVWWFEHDTPFEPEELAGWFLQTMGNPFAGAETAADLEYGAHPEEVEGGIDPDAKQAADELESNAKAPLDGNQQGRNQQKAVGEGRRA